MGKREDLLREIQQDVEHATRVIEGERDYLRDFSRFLDDLRNRTEQATGLPRGGDAMLRQEGESLIQLMRQKRDVLRDKLEKIRRAIATLH
jgi:hypothetical protein